MAESSDTRTATSTGAPNFPWASLLVIAVGLGGTFVLREVATHTPMSAAVYWTGVLAGGLVAGLGMTRFQPRVTRWQQARKEAGTSSWWHRLP